jgi:hypothetical protein
LHYSCCIRDPFPWLITFTLCILSCSSDSLCATDHQQWHRL